MFSEKFEEALSYAARIHRDQVRKGANIPYISHLMSVSAMVMERFRDGDGAWRRRRTGNRRPAA